MSGRCWKAPLLVLLVCLPNTAYPQLGEVHLGPVVSYGGAAPYGLGAGLALGVAAGRLAYVGLRWTYQTGRTQPAAPPSTTVDVRSRVQLFTADLGLQVPVGGLEIVPGGTLGVAWFAQRAGGPTAGSQRATELVGGPSLSVQVHMAGLVVIPEAQYQWAGDPDLPSPVAHSGPVASLRVVIPFEVDRIRY